MHIPARFISRYIVSQSEYPVLDDSGNQLFIASAERAMEMAQHGQVTGRGSRNRLRFLQLIVPIQEAVLVRSVIQRASTTLSAEDSQTSYRELPRTYTHNFAASGAYGGNEQAYRTCGSGLRPRPIG